MEKEKKDSRMKNSIRNVGYSFGSYFITIILQFINRMVFIRLLTSEYLGLNGLFSNILSFLSLAELGAGSAINYALYEPIENNDIKQMKSLMKLYRKLYWVSGGTVLFIGVLLTPFLPYLIKDMPKDMPYIYWYYILYVLNSGLSYFFTYKRSLIICNQKEYISTVTTTVAKLLLSITQIMVLLVSHSYMAYLLIAVFVTLGENITISKIADRMYPYLKDKDIAPLSLQVSAKIKKNITAMLFHKIGTVIVFSTDNMMISKFVGLAAVGLYSNYTLVINSISGLVGRIFSAITASVGNLALSRDTVHIETVLYRVLFLNFWIRGFCSIALFCLFPSFLCLWIGDQFLLSTETLFIIVLNFYIGGMRSTVNTFKDASGNFWFDRYKPLIESVLNLVLSVPLVIHYGIAGVLIGTIGSTLLVPFWFEAYVLFKHLLHKGISRYMAKQVYYIIVTFLAGCVTWSLCGLIQGRGIGSFVVRLVMCCIVPNTVYLLVFYKTKELRYYVDLVKKKFSKQKKHEI